MTLADVVNREGDIVEITFTRCAIVTPKSALSNDYWHLEDYKVSSRCGAGLFLLPRDYGEPLNDYAAAVHRAREHARAHENDPDIWRLIHKPGTAAYWESGDGTKKVKA